MTTHAARTITFSASCPQNPTHDAEWSSTTDAQPSAKCGTCDPPPDPRPDRYLRDVDSHLRRRA